MLKVLLLNNRVPYPLRDGGAKATYSLIQGLTRPGVQLDCLFLNTQKHFLPKDEVEARFNALHEVYTIPVDTNVTAWGAIASFLQGNSYNVSRFDQKEVHNTLKSILKKEAYDIVHFENLFMAPYLSTVRRNSQSKCVLRMHNVEHQIWEKLSLETQKPLKKKYLRYLSEKLKQYEEQILTKFDALIPISHADLNWAAKRTQVPLLNLPMGMNFETYRPQKTGKDFFHIGSMEWLPNRRGCDYLVNQIWPKVLQKDPDCHLHLAGKGMGQEFQKWASDRIHMHGEVDKAKQFMLEYNVMLIPLKSASGLRIKALEAMSLGIPVISTKVGMSGLLNARNAHFRRADSDEDWVKSILDLANNEELQEQLGQEGFTFVSQHYDEKTLSDQLIKFYENLIQ